MEKGYSILGLEVRIPLPLIDRKVNGELKSLINLAPFQNFVVNTTLAFKAEMN